MMSPFQGAEVEEAEINRFFYFENKGRGDEDPRNVGLYRQHPSRPVCIGSRRFQEIDQFLRLLPFRGRRLFPRRQLLIGVSADDYKSAFMPCFQRSVYF